MVASSQLENPFCKGISRQRGKGFGALGQVNGRNAIPFLCCVTILSQLPNAKVLTCWNLLFQKLLLVSGGKRFKTAATTVERQTLRKQLGCGSRKKVQPESFEKNLQYKPVGHEDPFSQSFVINHNE